MAAVGATAPLASDTSLGFWCQSRGHGMGASLVSVKRRIAPLPLTGHREDQNAARFRRFLHLPWSRGSRIFENEDRLDRCPTLIYAAHVIVIDRHTLRTASPPPTFLDRFRSRFPMVTTVEELAPRCSMSAPTSDRFWRIRLELLYI